MSSIRRRSQALARPRSALHSLIAMPDLGRTIEALPPPVFAAMVRNVGIEDAGELVALATTEQLVEAFDEELFVSERAGERESLDVGRFVVWLEVLLEAGDEAAAARIAELDEDFVAHALGGVVLVFDEDELRGSLDEGDEDESRSVDKALESSLTEDLDGYLLVATRHDGWDAVLALILALDRHHRPLLVRLLDRLARIGSDHLEDLDELATVLSEGESLADDVEAAREERRTRQGYVEPRAARAFLALARTPIEVDTAPARDPLTRAHLRDVERARPLAARAIERDAIHALPPAVLRELEAASGSVPLALGDSSASPSIVGRLMEALRRLGDEEPRILDDRMEEFAYLANVLVAGLERDGNRLRPKDAADAVITTVAYGAVQSIRSRRTKAKRKSPVTTDEFVAVLRDHPVDWLFRIASSAVAGRDGAASRSKGVVWTADELEERLR